MFVSENMSPFEKWDPRNAVLSRLTEKNRRERKATKSRQHAQYKGIFELQNEGDGKEENSEDGEEERKKKK